MIWIVVAVVYGIGLMLVAAALHHEVESKPKTTAAIIILWPILLPLMWIGLVFIGHETRR
jgi:ABC-type sugar transport system permease subunit